MFLKIVHKGFPSNCQPTNKTCDLRNTLINGGNLQQAEFNTQDSGKIALATVYRVYTDWYWLHSLVHFKNWLQSVPAGTGYTALYTCFNNGLQCTDWYWLHSLVHLLQQQLVTVYLLVLATQPCTLASTTGYRVYRLVLATQPCTLASTTGYRVYRLVLATQSCTLASTYRLQVY